MFEQRDAMMLLIVGTVRVPPGGVLAAKAAMAEMIAASRAEVGCLDYVYAEDVLDPGLVHVKEMWTDRAALRRHFGTDHISRWRASWQNLGISARDLRLYEVGDPEPI
jgi:quinol monooxygenase YgiN